AQGRSPFPAPRGPRRGVAPPGRRPPPEGAAHPRGPPRWSAPSWCWTCATSARATAAGRPRRARGPRPGQVSLGRAGSSTAAAARRAPAAGRGTSAHGAGGRARGCPTPPATRAARPLRRPRSRARGHAPSRRSWTPPSARCSPRRGPSRACSGRPPRASCPAAARTGASTPGSCSATATATAGADADASELEAAAEALPQQVNEHLPADVRCRAASWSEDLSFCPRGSARKTYTYYISPALDPPGGSSAADVGSLAEVAWILNDGGPPLDAAAMREAACALVGRHDFALLSSVPLAAAPGGGSGRAPCAPCSPWRSRRASPTPPSGSSAPASPAGGQWPRRAAR
ncbi:unnamed protein product, partial [Prorocentrum cordatum]